MIKKISRAKFKILPPTESLSPPLDPGFFIVQPLEDTEFCIVQLDRNPGFFIVQPLENTGFFIVQLEDPRIYIVQPFEDSGFFIVNLIEDSGVFVLQLDRGLWILHCTT